MPEPFPDRDRDDFVVLPDRGPKVPRIQCHAHGHFQVNIEEIERHLVVKPNGFSIVGLPTEDHPNGEQRIIPPPPWPPEWWPSIAAQPDRFQIGVPTVPPPWEDEDENGNGGDGEPFKQVTQSEQPAQSEPAQSQPTQAPQAASRSRASAPVRGKK